MQDCDIAFVFKHRVSRDKRNALLESEVRDNFVHHATMQECDAALFLSIV
jgi:hypothetical protein